MTRIPARCRASTLPMFIRHMLSPATSTSAPVSRTFRPQPQGDRCTENAAPDRLPLYEAKLIHQFDHRWATYTPDGDSRDMALAEKQDPASSVTPRYWVSEEEVEERLTKRDRDGNLNWRWDRGWLMGWRDITNATNERTVIASVVPRVGVGNQMPLMLFAER